MATEGVVSEVVSEKPIQEETGELSDEQCPGSLKLEEESSGNSTDNAGLGIDEKLKTIAMLNVIKVGDLENIDCGVLIRTAHQSIPQDSSEESKAVQSIVPGNLEYSEGGDFIEAPLNIHASLDKIRKDINTGLEEEKQFEIGKEMMKSDTLWQNDNIGEMEKKDESTERGHSSDPKEKAACDATLARQRSREWSSKNEKGEKLPYAKALELTSKEGITGDNVEQVPALAVKDLDNLNLKKEKVEDEMAFSKDNLKNEECNKMEVFEINKEDLNSHIDLMCEKIVITESLMNIKYETSDEMIERKETGQIEHLEGDLHISQCSTKVTLQEDEGQKIEELPDSLPEEIFLASTGMNKTADETIADRTAPDETFQSDEIVAELQATSGGIDAKESAIVPHLVGEVEHKQDQEVSSTAGKDVDGSADEDKKKQGSSEIETYMQDITKNDNELHMETEKSKGRDLCEDHKLEHGKKVSKSIDADKTSENVSVQEDEVAEPREQQSFDENQELITLSDDDLNEGTTDAIKSDNSSSAQSTVEKCLPNEHEENVKLAATADMIQEEDKFHKDKDLDEGDTQVNECKTLQGSDSHSEESAKLTGPDYEPSQTGRQEDAGLSTIESSAREKMNERDPKSNTEKCIDTVGYEEGNMKAVTQRDEGDSQKHDNHLETLSFGDEAAEGHTNTEKEHIHKEPNCSKILERKTQEEETGGDKHEQEADKQKTDYHESSKMETLSEQTNDAHIKEEKREDLTILEQENNRINDLKEEDITHEDPVDKSNVLFPVTHESVRKTLEEEEDMMQKEVPRSDTEEAIHETTNINMIVGAGCERHEKPPVETPATFGKTEENESTSDTHLKEQVEPGRDQEATSAVSNDAGGITDEDTQKKVYSEIELCTEDISKDDRELSVQDDEILVPREHLPFNKNEEIVILVGEEVMKGGETDVIKFETSSSVRFTADKCVKNEHQENEKLAARAEMIQEKDQSDRVMDLNKVDSRAKKYNALCVSDSQAEKSSANIGVDYRQSQTDTKEDGSLTTIASSERNKMVWGALKSSTKNDKPVEGDEEGNLKAVIPIDEKDDQKLDNYQDPLSFGDDAAGGTYIEREHIFKKPKCSEVLETITQEDERGGGKLEKEEDKQALDDREGSKQDNLSEETNNAHLKKEKIKEGTIPEEENKRTDDLQETGEEHTDKSNTLLSVTHELVEETLEEIGTVQKGTPRSDTEQAIYETTNIHMTIEAGCKKHKKYPTELRATIRRTEDNESSSDTTLTEQVAHVRDQKDTSTLPKDAGESLGEDIQKKCCSEMEPCAQDISNNNRELDTQDDQIEMPHENISFSKNQETITIAGEGIKEETTDTIKFETSSSPQSTEEKCLGSEHQENEKLAATAEVIQEEDQFPKDEDLCEVDSKANECNNLWGSDSQDKESSNTLGADHEPSQAATQDGSLTTIGSSAREKMNDETPRPNTEKCKDTYAYEEGNLKAVTQSDEEDSEPLPLTDAAATARGDTYTEKEHTCKESDCYKIPGTNTHEEEEEHDKLQEEANEQPPEIQESSKPANVDQETKTAHMKEEKSQDAVTLEQESKRINDLMEESITREEHPAKSNALLPENHESDEKTLEEEEDIMQGEAPKSNNEENLKAVTQSDEEDSETLPFTDAAARGDTYIEKEHTLKVSDCSQIPETNIQEEEEECDELREEANEQPPEIQSSKPENVDQETKNVHMKEEKSQVAVTLEQESKRINDLMEESITREEHSAKSDALLPENHESVEKTMEEEEDIIQREAPKSDHKRNLKAVTQSDEDDSEPLPLTDAAARGHRYIEKEHTLKESDCSQIPETTTQEEEEEHDKLQEEANEQPPEIRESSKPENVDQETKSAHKKEEKSQDAVTLEQESKRINDLMEESITREEHPAKSNALLPENHESVEKTLEEEEDIMQGETPKSNNEENLKAVTQSDEEVSEPLPLTDAAARGDTYTEKEHTCKESDCSKIPKTNTQEEEEEHDKLREEANEQPPEIQESSKPENVDRETKTAHMKEEQSQDAVTLEQESKRINDLMEESITREEHPAKSNALLPENQVSVEKTPEEEEDIMQREAPKSDNKRNLKAVTQSDEEDSESLPLTDAAARGDTYIEKEHTLKESDCSQIPETNTQEEEEEHDRLQEEANEQPPEIQESSKPENVDEETKSAHMKEENSQDAVTLEQESKRINDLMEESITREEHLAKSNARLPENHESVEKTLEEEEDIMQGEAPKTNNEENLKAVTQSDEEDSEPLPLTDAAARGDTYIEKEEEEEEHDKLQEEANEQPPEIQESSKTVNVDQETKTAHMKEEKSQDAVTLEQSKRINDLMEESVTREQHPVKSHASPENHESVEKTLEEDIMQREAPKSNNEENLKAVTQSDEEDSELLPLTDVAARGDTYTEQEHTCKESDCSKIPETNTQEDEEERDKLREEANEQPPEIQESSKPTNVDQETKTAHMKEEKSQDAVTLEQESKRINDLMEESVTREEHPAKSHGLLPENHESVEKTLEEEEDIMQREAPKSNNEKNLKAVTQSDEEDSEPLPLTDAAARGDRYIEKEHTLKESDCSQIPETNIQEEEEQCDELREEANEQPPEIQESSKPENVDQETKNVHMKEEKSQDAVTLEQESKRINDLMEESITREEHSAKSDALLPENHESVEKTMEEEEDIMQREAPKSDNKRNLKAVTQCDEKDSEPLPLTDATARGDTYIEREHTRKESHCSQIPETNTQEEEEERDNLREEANEQPPKIQESSKPENVDQETKNVHFKEEKSQDAVTLEQESKRINDFMEESITREEHSAKSDAPLPENHESVEKTLEEEEDIMQREAPKSDNEGNLNTVTQCDEEDSERLPLGHAAARGDTNTEKKHTCKESDCSKIPETNTQEEEEERDKLREEVNEQPPEIQESSKPENVDRETKTAHMKEEQSQDAVTLEQESKRINDLMEESITREEHPAKSNALLPENHESVEKTLQEEEDIMQREAPKSNDEENLKAVTQSDEEDSEPLPLTDAAARGDTYTEKEHTCKESDCSKIPETNTQEEEEEEERDKLQEEANEQPPEIQESSKPENVDQETKNAHLKKNQDAVTLDQESKRINDLNLGSITREEHPAKSNALLPENHEPVEKTLEEEEDTTQKEAPKSDNKGNLKAVTQSDEQDSEPLPLGDAAERRDAYTEKEHTCKESDCSKISETNTNEEEEEGDKPHEEANEQPLEIQESSKPENVDQEIQNAHMKEEKCQDMATLEQESKRINDLKEESITREEHPDKSDALLPENHGLLKKTLEEEEDTMQKEAPKSDNERNLKAATQSEEDDSEPLPVEDAAARRDTHTEKKDKCKESDCSKISETNTKEEEEKGDKLPEEANEQPREIQESSKPENVDQEIKNVHMEEEKSQDVITLEQEIKRINDLKEESITHEEHPAKNDALLPVNHDSVEKTLKEEEDFMQQEAPKSVNEGTVHAIPDIHMTTGTGYKNHEMSLVKLQVTFGRTEENESTSDTHLKEQDESARDQEVSLTVSKDAGGSTDEDTQNKASPEGKLSTQDISKDDKELNVQDDNTVKPRAHLTFNKNQEIITLVGVELQKEGTTDAIKFEASSSVQSTKEKFFLNEHSENEKLASTAQMIQEEDQSHIDMDVYEVNSHAKKCNTLCIPDSQSENRSENLGAKYKPSETVTQEDGSLTTMESSERENLNQAAPKLSTEKCECIVGYEDGNLKAVIESDEGDGQKLHNHQEPLLFEDNASAGGRHTEKEHMQEELKSSKNLETSTQEEEREGNELEEEADEQTPDNEQISKLENSLEESKNVSMKNEKSQDGIVAEQVKKATNNFTEENIANEEHLDKSNVLLPSYHQSVKETLEEEEVGIMQKEVPSYKTEEAINESIKIHMVPEAKGEKHEKSPAEPQATLGRIEVNETDSVNNLTEEVEHEIDQEGDSAMTKEAVGSIDGDSQIKSSSSILYVWDILKDDRDLDMERPKSEGRHLSKDHKLEHCKDFKATDADRTSDKDETVVPHEHSSLNKSQEITSLVSDNVLNEGTSDAIKLETSSPAQSTQVKYLLNEQQENEKLAAMIETVQEKDKFHQDKDLYEMDSQANKCNTLWESGSQAEKRSKNIGTDYEPPQTYAQEYDSLSTKEPSAREKMNQEAQSETKECNNDISYEEEYLKAVPQRDERDGQKLENYLEPFPFGDEAAGGGEETEKEHIYKELNCSKILETSTKETEGDKLEEEGDEQIPDNQKSSKLQNLSEETKNENSQYEIGPEQKKNTNDLKEESITDEDYSDKSIDCSPVTNVSVEETMEEVGIIQKEASTFDTEEAFNDTSNIHMTVEIMCENHEKSLKSLCSEQDHGITTDKESTMDDTPSCNAKLDKGTLSSSEIEKNENNKWDEEHIHESKSDDEGQERNIELSSVAVTVLQDNDKIGDQKYQESSISEYEWTHETEEQTCIQVLESRSTNGTKILAEDNQDNVPQMNESGTKQPENSFGATKELKLTIQKQHDRYVEKEILVKQEQSSQEEVGVGQNLEVVVDMHPRNETEKTADDNASETKIMHESNLHDNAKDLPVTPGLIPAAVNKEVDKIKEATPLICEADMHGNKREEITEDDIFRVYEKYSEGSECGPEDKNQEIAYETGVTVIKNAALSPLQIFEEEIVKKVAPPVETQVQTNKETETSKSIHSQQLEEEGTTNKRASVAIREQNILEDEKMEKDSEVGCKERPEIVAIHNIEDERAKQENPYTSIEEDLSKVPMKFEMPASAEDVTSEKRTIKDEGASTDIVTMTMGHPTLEQSFKKGKIEAKYEEETCESEPNVIEKVSEKAKDVMEMGVPNEEVESEFIPLAQGLKHTACKEYAEGSTTEADGITVKINSHEDESCGQLYECGKILYAVDTEELPSIHLKDNQRNMADESNIAMTRRTENKEVEETKLEAVETEPVKIKLSDDNDTHDKTDENQIDGTIGSYKEFIQNHEKSSRIEVSDAKTSSDNYGNEEMGGSSQERSDENSCLTLSESGNDIHHKNKAEDIKENILEKEASTEVHEVASISELSKEMFQSEEKREKRLEEEENQQESEPNSKTADEIPTGQVEESISKPSKHNPDATDSEEPMKVTSLEIVCDEVEKSADLPPGLSHEAVFGGKQQTQFGPEKARDGESIDEIEGLGTTSADSETSVTMTEDGEHEAEACRSLLTEQSVENTNTQEVDESKELPEPNPVSKSLFENKEIRKAIDEVPSMNVHLSSHTDVATEQITSEEVEEELVVSKKNNLSSTSDDISGAEISDEAKDPTMTSADLLSTTVIDTEYAKEVSSALAVPMSLRKAIGQKGHGKEQAEEFSLVYSEKTKQNFNLNEDNEFNSKSLETRPPSKNSESFEHNLEMVSSSEEIQINEYWDKAQNKSTTSELCADDTMSAEVSNKFENGYDSPPELPKDEDAKDEFQDMPSTTSTALFEEHIRENTISDEENKNFSLEGIKSASGSVKDEKVETPSSTSAPINITHITNQRYESSSDVGHYASTVKRELGGALADNNDGKRHLKAFIVVFNEQTENVDSQEITMREKQSEFLGCKQVSVAEKLVFEEREVMKSTEDENHEPATFETPQNDQDKQMDVSYLPVSQFLIDRIMREEDEKSQIMIQGIEDGCEGVDNTKQELNLSSDKHSRIEECITQNTTEVPKSYDAQESPIDEGEPMSNISSFPAIETLVEDAKKDVFLSENLTDTIPKNDDKHATTEKGETQSELKDGEFIGLGPRSHEKSDGIDEVTERKVTLNDNRALIENPDTPSVAKTDSNKILQEESCPKSVDAIEIQPSIEMLEKATIEEHPPETRVTIETKNFIGVDENLLKTWESSRSVLEVNQVLGDASEFAPEGKEVKTKVDDKHDGITDAQIEGQFEKIKLSDSGKAHPSESLKDSTDDSNQIAERILEEKCPAINRDELNKEVTDTKAGIDETKSFIGIDETLLKNQETITSGLEVNQVPQDDLALAPEGKELKTQMDDKHDEDTHMDTTAEGPTDRTKSSDSDKAHQSKSEKDSIDDSIQIAESILKEKNLAAHRDELNKDVMDMKVADEKSDEEDEKDAEEHEFDKSGTDDPVTVETRDQEPKMAHKKSHNILSGVKSKVKHSIAKVKKAITGKSSHSKTTSPK